MIPVVCLGPIDPDEEDRMLAENRRHKQYVHIFNYDAQEKHSHPCDACGTINGFRLAHDRYGYTVGVAECPCGLVYLNPRMTDEAYGRFYRDGTYRRLVSAFHGREINAKTLQPEQLAYAHELETLLAPHMEGRKTLLDVGGSTGVVAGYIAGRFGLKGTVLDPAPDELAEAHGLKTVEASIEDWSPRSQWDVVLLCQTIDHLLSPKAALRKVRSCMASNGLLFVDIVDYSATGTLKIDHPFNFTDATMRAALHQGRFRCVEATQAPDGVHRRYLARPAW